MLGKVISKIINDNLLRIYIILKSYVNKFWRKKKCSSQRKHTSFYGQQNCKYKNNVISTSTKLVALNKISSTINYLITLKYYYKKYMIIANPNFIKYYTNENIIKYLLFQYNIKLYALNVSANQSKVHSSKWK